MDEKQRVRETFEQRVREAFDEVVVEFQQANRPLDLEAIVDEMLRRHWQDGQRWATNEALPALIREAWIEAWVAAGPKDPV